MDLNNFLLFAFASLMLNITPGSDMLYVATRSTGQGVRAGIVSAVGITAGCFVHIIAAAAGLSMLLARSVVAFSIVKFLGAAYLLYLAWKAFTSRDNSFVIQTPATAAYKKIFFQGAVTNVLNPKVALFFLAFLPQFVNTTENVPFTIVLLGTWFNFSGLIVNVAVALAFGKMGNFLTRNEWFVKWQNRLTGLVFLFLGLKIALTKNVN